MTRSGAVEMGTERVRGTIDNWTRGPAADLTHQNLRCFGSTAVLIFCVLFY